MNDAEENKYIILQTEIERIEYSGSFCGASVDWFNFLTWKKAAVNQKLEDLMSKLLQDQAVQQKMSAGSRLTIHTRFEKRDADINNTLDHAAHGEYLLYNTFTYYIAELHFDWSKPRWRCVP